MSDAPAAPVGGARPLRVVYLGHVARLSGGELALLRLLPALTGVDAEVVLAEEGPLVGRLRAEGVRVRVLPLADAARELRKDQAVPGVGQARAAVATGVYVVRVARLLRRLRPDLVHTNTLKAGVYGSLAARLAGVPVVWHARDRIAPDYLPSRAVGPLRALIRQLARHVVANSRHTLETVEGGRPLGGRASVVGEVVRPPPARPSPCGADIARPLAFALMGRLAPWKGQDVFLRAFAAAFPRSDERAVIIGSAMFGEDDFGASLHRLAADLGIADRVEWRGFREDVDAELARVDALVHASRTPEPFGQVVLEGMAAGLPVAATRAGGPGEVITDGADGLLVDNDDEAALAEALRRLAADGALRQRLGVAARRRAADFSAPAVAADMLRAYRRALGPT